MTDEVNGKSNAPDKDNQDSTNVVDIDAVRKDAKVELRQAEQARRKDINALFASFPQQSELLSQCLDDMDCTADNASKLLLDTLGSQVKPVAGRIESGEDEKTKLHNGMQAALMARAGLEKDDSANNYRGYTLYNFAQEALRINGHSFASRNKIEIVGMAFTHTTSDFSNILRNVANKSMLSGWEEQEETYPQWTRRGTLPDFKQAHRVDLNLFPNLLEVPEGGEYKEASIGDRGETIQLATYGRLFSITRQAIINDDLDAMTRIPQRMGRAARRTVGNLVYAVLTSNPLMSDGVALFHTASHGNLAASGAPPNTATVDAMRVAMATQKDPDSLNSLNIRMQYLLVPVALEGTANVVRDSQFEVGASNKNNTIPNSVQGTFEVISDARLDDDSATAWYGAASSTMHDTIEVAYLDGDDTPFIEDTEGWTIDGTNFKVRIDAGVKALDYRGLQKNPGV